MEPVNPKTGMTHGEARQFIRNHFEEFVNKKNVQIGNINFAADFVDHGADVPPGMPPGPAGAIAYVSGALKKFPDLHGVNVMSSRWFFWRASCGFRLVVSPMAAGPQIQEGGFMSTPTMYSSTLSGQEMSGARVSGRYLRFGQFQVDLQREELFREGSRVRVPSKVFQVLMALIARPGEIVTREALRARLWPGGTFVNYDANVNTAVNKLRLAPGDSPDQPMYVETIPRQGYCFLGNVERCNELVRTSGILTIAAPDAVDAGIGPKIPPPASSKSNSGRLATLFRNGWGAAILLCGLLIGVGIVLIMHRPQ